VKGKPGLYGFGTPFQDIQVLGKGGADILQHDHPFLPGIVGQVRIAHFGIPHDKGIPFCAIGNLNIGEAYHVLTHIIHVDPFPYRFYRSRRECLHYGRAIPNLAYELQILIMQFVVLVGGAVQRYFHRLFPGRIIKIRCCPAINQMFLSRIINFPLKKAAITQRPIGK